MKVSILGAGPAGSTAAFFLASAGIETELIDIREFPRDKTCAGGLFNPLLYFRDFPYLEEADGKYLYRAIFSCGKHSMSYTSKTPLIKTFVRKDLDFFLLNKALKAGAALFINKPPEGEVIIDATGARRARDYPKAGVCLAWDFPAREDTDTVYIHYAFQGIVGYGWAYPKKGFANIGIGALLPQKNMRSIYWSFLEFLESERIFSAGKKSFSVKLIPFAPRRSFHEGSTLLAGDRAGFVKPATGEGIYFAMLSGRLAAQSIIEGKPASWYEEQCRKGFGQHLKPLMFSWSRPLLFGTLEKAIKIGSRDELFKKMFAENFFRLGSHNLALRYTRHLFT